MLKPNFQTYFPKILIGSILVVLTILASGNSFQTFAQKTNNAKQLLEAEQLLSNLGYWVLKVDGVKDASTYHAITAFQKVEGRKRTGILNEDLLNAMRTASRPQPKFNGAAHIEVDISRQVLFLVDANGTITHILPVSSGSEAKYFDEGKWQIAHTPRGEFKIERRINGVRKAPLGSLYYPNYFHEGVAIHGSNSIPVKPASHGCVRIPRFADQAFFNLVWLKMEVYVYD
ncbi:MAG TPA: L,D-transpeptidase family protein [Pyrinomonadaceae bacterium]|nr:L,D-transpeptidase family protein [Pyrinomonadaceae bacterium]